MNNSGGRFEHQCSPIIGTFFMTVKPKVLHFEKEDSGKQRIILPCQITINSGVTHA